MMKLPDILTIGESYEPAMKITTQTEADEYFSALVERQMRCFGDNQQKAEQIQRSNLGYFAGYYNVETRLRVERLFRCAHPIFGKAENGVPSAEEAFEIGKTMGAKQ